MQNEILLLFSVLLTYGTVLVAYKLFGKNGLYAMTVIATILANIEVLILIEGFGIQQTLGNVMFASTYLITDILSENYGKKYAATAVWLGIFASFTMLVFTQYWRLYIPSAENTVSEHIFAVFSTTPRVLLASFLGHAISQRAGVWLYHKWWSFTTKKTGNSKRFLWIRNNFSTLVSQVLNTVIFTLVGFLGVYETKSLLYIMLSSYIIYIFTSLLDTPILYIARAMNEKAFVKNTDI